MRLEDKAILLPTDIAMSPPEKAMKTYIIMSLLIVMQRVHLFKLVQNISLPDFSSAFLPIFPPPPQYCKYDISLIATIKTLLSPYRGPSLLACLISCKQQTGTKSILGAIVQTQMRFLYIKSKHSLPWSLIHLWAMFVQCI